MLRTGSIRFRFLCSCRRSSRCSAVLASEVGYTGKTIDQKRLAPDSLVCSVPTTLPMVFLGRCSSVKVSRTTVPSLEVLILIFFLFVTTPHHRCSVVNMAWDRLVSVGRMQAMLGIWLATQTNAHLARLIAGVKEGPSRRSRHISCQRKCRCSRF